MERGGGFEGGGGREGRASFGLAWAVDDLFPVGGG